MGQNRKAHSNKEESSGPRGGHFTSHLGFQVPGEKPASAAPRPLGELFILKGEKPHCLPWPRGHRRLRWFQTVAIVLSPDA